MSLKRNESSYLRFSNTGPYELEQSPEVIEQIIRPTGLLDPPIDIRPIEGQIDDLLGEIQDRIAKMNVY